MIQNSNVFQYVKIQTNELCLIAVSKNGYLLQFVKNQTDEICLASVKQYGESLFFVENQTDMFRCGNTIRLCIKVCYKSNG